MENNSLPPLYTLIAYKPDSSDYCMGCHMASYSSNFEFANNLTRKELIEKTADILFSNSQLRMNESEHEITIIRDGIMICQNGSPASDRRDRFYKQCEETDPEYWDKLEEIEAQTKQDEEEAAQIMGEAQTLADQKLAAHTTKQQEAKAAKEAKKQAEKEANERRQLAELQAKYKQ